MTRTGKNLQHGIAIGPILFVVAILAVLASAIAAGSGAFNGDTSAVRNKALAVALLEYADSVKMGVDRVRGHGCLDTQISFENPVMGGYTNPNAPSDKSCHVFDQNGGGIVWKNPPKELIASWGNNWGIRITNSGRSIPGLGTKESDVFLELHGWHAHFDPAVRLPGENLVSVCKEVNSLLGISSPNDLPYVRWFAFETVFTGVLPESVFDDLPSIKILGKTSFCAIELTGDMIIFTKALIVR